MTDLLIALTAFLLVFQGTALLLRSKLAMQLLGLRSRASLSGFFAPALLGLAVVGFAMLPHWFGALTGGAHASSDVDALATTPPSLWPVLTLALVALYFLVSASGEVLASVELRRHLRSPDKAAAGRVSTILEDFRRAGHRTPAVIFHDCHRWPNPFLRGALRPTIYLHSELTEALSLEHLRAVLAHELGHLNRRDQLVSLAYALAIAPLDLFGSLRQSYAEWSSAAEHSCDDFAAELVGSNRRVAEALVAVVRAQHQAAPRSAAALCGHSSVKQRVQRLLENDESRPPVTHEPPELRVHSFAALLLAFSAIAPEYGLEVYCFLEHLVGTHCVG